ncbi:MAG: ATP-binding cassette domain-containing protein [Eubacteriales bacterium]|nr:ATP-binding cassette domain-containing protein [Eubacteriales bacterium]
MIVLERVCKSFDGHMVLRDIDWQIAPGERWLIRGASGIGKTTLLRLLMGLERPDRGTLSGTDGLRFAPVFQEDRLVEHWSAQANVALVCPDAAQVQAILHRLLPAQALDQPVRTLSGGMRRRVALARALAAESDVLVLDEAFAGLDRGTALRTAQVLEDFRDGRTVIAVSHSREDVSIGYRTLTL